MKILLSIVGLFLLMIPVYCFDFNKDEFFVKTDIEEGIIVTKTELLYVQTGFSIPKVTARANRLANLINENGYVDLQISGKHYFVINLNGLLITPAEFEIDSDNMNPYGINSNIKISTSSNLTEIINSKKTEYKPIYMLNRLTREKEIGEYLYWSARPWATNPENDPTPVISITSDAPIGSFLILNGYIDFKKPRLYLDNSRVKKIEIFDRDNKTSIGAFEIIDICQYVKIALPKKLKNFDMIITDLYKGNRFSDICISSIIFDEAYTIPSGDFGKSELEELRKEIGF
jgi:hypothetical protein